MLTANPPSSKKPIHYFNFNKDPPPFVLDSDVAATRFKNECASVHNAGASLIRGSSRKEGSVARKIATGGAEPQPEVKEHPKKEQYKRQLEQRQQQLRLAQHQQLQPQLMWQ